MLAIFLTACSGDEEAAQHDESSPSATPEMAQSATLLVAPATATVDPIPPPADLFDELRRLDETSVLLVLEGRVAECLAEQGFEWTPPTGPSPEATTQIRALLDSPPTMTEIRQYGYEWRVARVERASALDNSTGGSELSGEARQRREECGQRVSQDMGYTEWQTLMQSVEQGEADVRAQVRGDGQYLEVQRRWSECVAGRGYSLDSLDHLETVETRDGGGVLSPDILAMAVADFECRFELDVFTVEAQLTNSYAAAWIDANPAIVSAIEDARVRLTAAVAEEADTTTG